MRDLFSIFKNIDTLFTFENVSIEDEIDPDDDSISEYYEFTDSDIDLINTILV